MITKKAGIDFEYNNEMALTLDPWTVRPNDSDVVKSTCSRTHENGWTVSGYVHEDYAEWVNQFEAHHPDFGRVWGDFEEEVFADSEEGFEDFYRNFPPNVWDYADI